MPAQEATAEEALLQIQRAVLQAWNDRDIDAILGHLTDDVEWSDPTQTAPRHGKDAVRDALRQMYAMVPDMYMAPENVETTVSLDPPTYAAKWIAEGTVTDPEGAEHRLSLPGVSTCTVRDGRICTYVMRY